jgi:hypothetical protein
MIGAAVAMVAEVAVTEKSTAATRSGDFFLVATLSGRGFVGDPQRLRNDVNRPQATAVRCDLKGSI